MNRRMLILPTPRRVAAFLACALMVCPLAGASQRQKTRKDKAGQGTVTFDPKQARKLVERGEKLEAEAKLEEALAGYDEAAKYAPNDAEVVGHGATLRARMVRGNAEATDRLAL